MPARSIYELEPPGISLKGEGVSYMAGLRPFPVSSVNVGAGRPRLGGIQPSQSDSDYWQATRALGHGDFQMVVYCPVNRPEPDDSGAAHVV